MRDFRTLLLLLALAPGVAVPAVLQAQDADAAQEAPAVQDSAAGGGQDSVGSAQQLESLADELSTARARAEQVEQNLVEAGPAQRTLFEFQKRRRWEEHHEVLQRLVAAIEEDPAAADSSIVALATDGILRELDTADAWLEEVRGEIAAELERLGQAPAEELVQGEIELTRLNAGVDDLMIAVAENLEVAGVVGLDLQERAASFDSTLVERTELLGAALEFSQEQATAYQGWLGKPGVDTVAVQLRISANEERISGTTASLQAMADLMEQRGFEASIYRRLIVTATGEISTEVLDTQVLGGLVSEWTRATREWVTSNVGVIVLRLVLILLLLLAAGRLAGVMRAATRRGVQRMELSGLIKNLLVSGAGKAVWVLAALVALSIFGIDLGPMLAGLGIVGFVVGFALQETLANFASGLMIMVYRPFDVGDFVTISGVTGKVKDLTLVSTVIRTLDNQRIIVPNGKVWGDVINNATAERIRRVDLVFGVAYHEDVDEARRVLEEVLDGHDRVLDEPEPMVRVGELADSSVNLLCRPWVRTDDYWEAKWEITRDVKKRFDEVGITFPFPQRDVHLHGLAPLSDAVAGTDGGGEVEGESAEEGQ